MSLNDYINSFVTSVLTPIMAAFITVHYSTLPNKSETARKMYENCFHPVFELVEEDLFKDISTDKIKTYGLKIQKIIANSNGYYHPSIKEYARKLVDINRAYDWQYFSERFTMRYDKICRKIGIPIRNKAYRINRRQYKSKYQAFIYMLANDWPTAILVLALLVYWLIKLSQAITN